MEEKRDSHAVFMDEYTERLARVKRDMDRARRSHVPHVPQSRRNVSTLQTTILAVLLAVFIVVFWR